MKQISILMAFLLTACVTINIYFPAAAAEKAADEIIKDIQKSVPAQKTEPKASLPTWQIAAFQLLDTAIATVITNAEAGDANLSIDSAEIKQLRTSLESRFGSLSAFYASGAIGIQANGLLVVKDLASVALPERNKVNKLVAAENSDRQGLYQAIANANGHPEWAAQIQSTFAAQWVSNAQAGWWFQKADGSWAQK
ncbi:MAG: YdbL family protein [Methylococcaceae bacterium]